jgi:hypothetical protein
MKPDLQEFALSNETQNDPIELGVGDEFPIRIGVPLLIGAGDGKRVLRGFDVCVVKDLANNGQVSKFGLQIDYDGHTITLSKPKLTLNGEPYSPENVIKYRNTKNEVLPIDISYNGGDGYNITDVYVGDPGANNGFVLLLSGNNRFRLFSINDNGKKTVFNPDK